MNREPLSHSADSRTPELEPLQTRVLSQAGGNGHLPAHVETEPAGLSASDLPPFLNALGRRWAWVLLGGAAMATIGLWCGLLLWKNNYTASAHLLRQAAAHETEVLGDRELAPNTYASLLRTPDLLQRIAAQASPPLAVESLARNLNINPERNSDVLLVTISAGDQQSAVNLANLYAEEAVKFTQELQTNAAARVGLFVRQQLAPLEEEIAALSKLPQQTSVRRSLAAAVPVVIVSPLFEKLQGTRLELADLLARFTDRHPLVREQEAKVAAIESQLRQMPPAPLPVPKVSEVADAGLLTQEHDPAFIHTKLQALENARLTLLGQKHAAISLESHPPGTCRVLSPATIKDVIAHKRTAKVAVLAGIGGVVGILFTCVLIFLGEAVDPRLRTAADVQRVTRLPVVATAGDLERMTEVEQKNWAFRAWTSLQHLLSPSPNQGFVCGITSSENGEGRSTWIKLLAAEASQRGFRVLTIVARPPDPAGNMIADSEPDETGIAGLETLVPLNNQGALVGTHVLSTPDEVTQKLIGPNPEPVVEIPLPGWVWNLEHRKQWQTALRNWSQIDNIALLVELPPASLPETVLLAQNLPNVIWLADSEKATAANTREQLETLRNARCNLAGAVLNRAPVSFLKNRFARWVGCAALIPGLFGPAALCQEKAVQSTNATVAVANTNLSFSVVTPAQRAAWQQRLTLGPGDVVTLALWGEPTLTRAEVAIGPDGRISFAEAHDILASGLTVDELRVKMNEELSKYRRAPQAMITPTAFRSKKYFVLGRVIQKGVYVLDRPITLLEAVVRARGFETGLVDRNIITVADFSRSFLMRRGKHYPLNFEGLFQNGDLSQNLSLEPNDYLYFPGANLKEVYILGEVRLPGPTAFTTDMTLMAAIAARAGYTDRAYKGRVLVVRGSLNKPETFVIETKHILAGKAPDFRLQPKDIIFVNSRPFIYAEDLADRAITVFLQSIVTATVGIHVITPVQEK